MPSGVIIKGDGIAASCCSRLLAGVVPCARIEPAKRSRVPALLIGDASRRLIVDVFGRELDHATPVTRIIVAWGGEPVEVAHSGFVIGEEELNAQLSIGTDDHIGEPAWVIYTSRSLPEECVDQKFGSRRATASAVRLRESAPPDACWIEALDRGWLFLLPGWMLTVGASADELLAQSRLVAGQIHSIESARGSFPAHPRISDPLRGENWLACGSAAIGFDPICGDGVGNAIREAILASAVIKAAERGEDFDVLTEHYRVRLLAGFLKHLELCRPFYSACNGDWWRAELSEINRGIAWCRERLSNAAPFRYQLRGFELELAANERK